MEGLWKDIRFGLRTLLRNPGTTAVALLALALGIGANTAIFSVVYGVLLKPLPYPDPDRLVMVLESNPRLGFPRFSVAPPNFADWRQQAKSFEHLVALNQMRLNLTGGEEPEAVSAERVSADFFAMMDQPLTLGRGFRPEEDRPGAPPVAVLTHGFWQRRFGSDPKAVDRILSLDGQPYTVVGVASPALDFPADRDVFVPLALDFTQESRGGHYLGVVGRLKPGVGLDEAREEMKNLAARLERQYPDSNSGWSANVTPLHDIQVEGVKPSLVLLMIAVGLVLLIACANVANLLLARMAAREREIAVRTALGAARGRLVRQILTESVLLSAAGGALGLLLAYWGTRALLALNPDGLPRAASIGLDPQVLLFTFIVAIATGLLFGLAPALSAGGGRFYEALKEGGRGMVGGNQGRILRNLLVFAEVALALLILVVASLLIRSFDRLQNVDPGFRSAGVLTLEVALPPGKYPDPPRQGIFVWQLMERLRGLAGVERAATVYPLPLGGEGFVLAYLVEGRPAPPPDQVSTADIFITTSDYFQVMGIPLLQGRTYTEQDNHLSMPVAVINRTMADKMWPNASPLGKRVTFDDPGNPNARWMSVIGVVGDVRNSQIDEDPASQVYWPNLQSPASSFAVVVRAKGDPGSLAQPVRAEIRALDPDQPVDRVWTLEDVVVSALSQSRFKTVLLAIFAAIALVLAAVGVYGVISYSVTQRTHEIGIRMALGAHRGQVLRMVVRQGMILVLVGVAAGLLGAWGLSRYLKSQVYEVSTADPLTFLIVPLVLLAVALVANVLPAQRATRVDPLEALRYE